MHMQCQAERFSFWTRDRIGDSNNTTTLMTNGFTIKIKCNWLHNNWEDHCIQQLAQLSLRNMLDSSITAKGQNFKTFT